MIWAAIRVRRDHQNDAASTNGVWRFRLALSSSEIDFEHGLRRPAGGRKGSQAAGVDQVGVNRVVVCPGSAEQELVGRDDRWRAAAQGDLGDVLVSCHTLEGEPLAVGGEKRTGAAIQYEAAIQLPKGPDIE